MPNLEYQNFYNDEVSMPTEEPEQFKGPSTPGPDRARPKGYIPKETSKYVPFCNYDGLVSGREHILQLDEYKVTQETVFEVPICYAEDVQTISGTDSPNF